MLVRKTLEIITMSHAENSNKKMSHQYGSNIIEKAEQYTRLKVMLKSTKIRKHCAVVKKCFINLNKNNKNRQGLITVRNSWLLVSEHSHLDGWLIG